MRKRLLFLNIMVLALVVICISISIAQMVQQGISIEQIKSGQYISGTVFGIDSSKYENYKVIVYVHTDKWYIHPYATGGEGKSYARIKNNGTWKIGTVKRDFPADQVAALIVERAYKPPAQIENIYGIKSLALTIRDTGYKEGDKDWLL